MCLHLSGWNLNRHVSLHSSSLVKSSCSIVESSLDLIILNILVSSANKYASEFTVSGRSFINMTNNNSPITEPCSIPDVTLCYADLSPFTPICCTLFDRKLSIQAISCSFMPYDVNLLCSRLCGTVSNVFW